jgi:hypothetical protein
MAPRERREVVATTPRRYPPPPPNAGVAEWQTRQTQNLLPVREWGFKSLHPHQLFNRLPRSGRLPRGPPQNRVSTGYTAGFFCPE